MGRGASIKVGAQVVLRLSGHPTTVQVVEDRGMLAPGKTRLLRIGVLSQDPADPPREFELSESMFDNLLVDETA